MLYDNIMSRVLGIDYGTKKIGFALSDEEQIIAFPMTVHLNVWKYIYIYISEVIVKEGVTEIVVGLPVGLDGKETELSKEVRVFAKKLGNTFNIPIRLENEVYSSAAIKTSGGAPLSKIDASSAALILQTFLDRRRKRNSNQS